MATPLSNPTCSGIFDPCAPPPSPAPAARPQAAEALAAELLQEERDSYELLGRSASGSSYEMLELLPDEGALGAEPVYGETNSRTDPSAARSSRGGSMEGHEFM